VSLRPLTDDAAPQRDVDLVLAQECRACPWVHPGSQRQGEPRGAALGLVGQVEPARAQRLELDGAALDVPHVGVRLR
jgi:hypothetical protein